VKVFQAFKVAKAKRTAELRKLRAAKLAEVRAARKVAKADTTASPTTAATAADFAQTGGKRKVGELEQQEGRNTEGLDETLEDKENSVPYSNEKKIYASPLSAKQQLKQRLPTGLYHSPTPGELDLFSPSKLTVAERRKGFGSVVSPGSKQNSLLSPHTETAIHMHTAKVRKLQQKRSKKTTKYSGVEMVASVPPLVGESTAKESCNACVIC
jgi:hypothetical protein